MSIRSSIFTKNETREAVKTLLPRLISPTLPPIYLSLKEVPPIEPLVVTNGANSYTLHAAHDGERAQLHVKLKITRRGKKESSDEDEPLLRKKPRSPKKLEKNEFNVKNETEPLKLKKVDNLVKNEPKKVENSTKNELKESLEEKKRMEKTVVEEKKVESSVLARRKEKSELFLGKSKHFRNVAASRKRESDDHRHNKEIVKSITVAIESVITFIIAFDYEDKSRLVEKKLITDKSWVTLEPYLDSIIRIIKDSMTQNRSLKYLLGLVSLIKALCCQHLIEITLALINNSKLKLQRDTNPEKKQQLKELIYTNTLPLVEYHREKLSSLRVFEKHLNHLDIKLNFPHTFKKRSLTLDPPQKQESLKPETDTFYIPLSELSSLQQVALFSHRLLGEFTLQLEQIKSSKP